MVPGASASNGAGAVNAILAALQRGPDAIRLPAAPFMVPASTPGLPASETGPASFSRMMMGQLLAAMDRTAIAAQPSLIAPHLEGVPTGLAAPPPGAGPAVGPPPGRGSPGTASLAVPLADGGNTPGQQETDRMGTSGGVVRPLTALPSSSLTRLTAASNALIRVAPVDPTAIEPLRGAMLRSLDGLLPPRSSASVSTVGEPAESPEPNPLRPLRRAVETAPAADLVSLARLIVQAVPTPAPVMAPELPRPLAPVPLPQPGQRFQDVLAAVSARVDVEAAPVPVQSVATPVPVAPGVAVPDAEHPPVVSGEPAGVPLAERATTAPVPAGRAIAVSAPLVPETEIARSAASAYDAASRYAPAPVAPTDAPAPLRVPAPIVSTDAAVVMAAIAVTGASAVPEQARANAAPAPFVSGGSQATARPDPGSAASAPAQVVPAAPRATGAATTPVPPAPAALVGVPVAPQAGGLPAVAPAALVGVPVAPQAGGLPAVAPAALVGVPMASQTGGSPAVTPAGHEAGGLVAAAVPAPSAPVVGSPSGNVPPAGHAVGAEHDAAGLASAAAPRSTAPALVAGEGRPMTPASDAPPAMVPGQATEPGVRAAVARTVPREDEAGRPATADAGALFARIHAAASGQPAQAGEGEAAARPAYPALAEALDRIAAELSRAAPGAVRSLEMNLDAPDLGRVRIRVALTEAGTVGIELVTPTERAASALRADLPQLTASLEGRGQVVTGAQVTVAAVGLMAGQDGSGQARQQSRWFEARGGRGAAADEEEVAVTGTAASYRRPRTSVDLVA